MTPYYKGLCYVVIFYKISNYFIKSLILFWQHFTKDPLQLNPNTILATFYKKPNTTLANFIKNPKLLIFGQKIILSKPKYYLAKILYYAQILKLIIFGNNIFWHAKSPSKYNNHLIKLFILQNLWKLYLFFHKKLQLQKPMYSTNSW